MIRTVKDLAGSLLILVVIWSYGRYFNRSFLCRKGFFRISIQFHLWQSPWASRRASTLPDKRWIHSVVDVLGCRRQLCSCTFHPWPINHQQFFSCAIQKLFSPLSCHSWQVLRSQFDAMQRKAKQEGSPEAIKLASRTLALQDDKRTRPETNQPTVNCTR